MRVTYIGHSGFLAEWEDAACLFDCRSAELPAISPEKRLYVFVSHAHSDHYDPQIYFLCREQPHRMFFLSSDVPGSPEEAGAQVVRLAPDRKRVVSGGREGALSVRTLGSTDQGVAFVVNYAGKTIYHAGDLHWWAWPDDSPEEERQMKNRFFGEIVKLKGLHLDAAFLPLDPRLGSNFWLGFDAVMRAAQVDVAFPMHLWERYETVGKLRQLATSAPYRDRIADVREPGQVFEF